MLEDIHCLQTHALLLMDEGKLEAAIEMLSGGRMLADEMAEKGLACRFGVNLAVAHNLRGDGAAALQYADGAVAAAADRKDTHFQAVAAVARAHALRLLRRYDEAGHQLTLGIELAESLGYVDAPHWMGTDRY